MPRRIPATLATDASASSPIMLPAIGDPGDETQRNFRYQHAYGVILLVAGAIGAAPYEAIWCEHHEDLLAERSDKTYDAFQVKTRRPEIGAWKLTDEAITHSISRFVQLDGLFGGLINSFVIVSNTDFATCGLEIKDVEELKRSPVRVLEAIQASANYQALATPFTESITRLAQACACTPEKLYEVLKRTYLVKGPSKEGFDTDVAHLHLPQIAACRQMVPAALNALRDELVQKVYGASSLQIENPLQHLYRTAESPHPRVLAKRVDVAVVAECLQQAHEAVFRYQTGSPSLTLGTFSPFQSALAEKLEEGGLGSQISIMKRRVLNTEQELIALAHAAPDSFDQLMLQLEGVVEGECAEAELVAQQTRTCDTDVYGPVMLADVYQRLREIAKNEPKRVDFQPYELLVGVAGLLTEKCTVWWSNKFQLQSS